MKRIRAEGEKMEPVRLWDWIVNHSAPGIQAGVTVLVQSTAVLCLGLLAMALAGRRGAALQSAIVRATLVSVLLCPAVAVLLGEAGVNGLRLQLPNAPSDLSDTSIDVNSLALGLEKTSPAVQRIVVPVSEARSPATVRPTSPPNSISTEHTPH